MRRKSLNNPGPTGYILFNLADLEIIPIRPNEQRMTTQPHTDADAAQISPETEHAVRNFVRAAVSRLSEVLNDQESEWVVDSRWERGTDGHFRERTKHRRTLVLILYKRLHSLPDYDTCVEQLKSDKVVGPHLDRLVGTKKTARRLEADDILRSAIYAMLNDEGALVFADERFDRE